MALETAQPKKSEFAPGISKSKPMSIMPVITKKVVFEFGVHDHDSAKAGKHYDLRLGDKKTGKAYSWAIPSARLPEPGDKPVLAIPTFIHNVRYMDFEGIIGSDYGKGTVKLPHRGKAIIHYASPEKTKFSAVINGQLHTFVLFKPPNFKNAYLLSNVTNSQNEENKKEAQYMEQPQYQPTAPFSVQFVKRLPYYMGGALGAEFGVGYLGKRLLQKYPNFANKLPQSVSNFVLTRRPSIVTALGAGAVLSAAHAGISALASKLRRNKGYGY